MSTKDLLIIKTGTGLPSLTVRAGDFEDWILEGMQLCRDGAKVVDVRSGQRLPVHESIAGVVITGSHDMVTSRAEWSERTAAWLPRAVERGIPVLGICYGHQLLAHALGGEVGDNPQGFEYGTVEVRLTGPAQEGGLASGRPGTDLAGPGLPRSICPAASRWRQTAGLQRYGGSPGIHPRQKCLGCPVPSRV